MQMCKRAALCLMATVLVIGLSPSPARAQALTDLIVTMSYFDIKPQAATGWVTLFKKHIIPVLEELREQEVVTGYHLFVPGLHRGGQGSFTHALLIGYKDRAAQGVAEKKIEEAFANAPAGEITRFQAAIDLSKHSDEEWREIDLSKVEVPEEKKKEEEETKEDDK